MGLEPGNPFRESLIQFLFRYPTETMDLRFRDGITADHDWNRFLEHFIRHANGKPFRDAVLGNTTRLVGLILGGLGNAHSQAARSPSDDWDAAHLDSQR